MQLINKYSTEQQLKRFVYLHRIQRAFEFLVVGFFFAICFLFLYKFGSEDKLMFANSVMILAFFAIVSGCTHITWRCDYIGYFSTALVTGRECLKISTWMTQYPAVQAYIEALNKQRPTTRYDYITLSDWVDNYEQWLSKEDERNACRRIQGIA